MQEMEILYLIRERLTRGYSQYGALDVHCGRDWPTEALEEVLDCMVYCAAQLIKMKKSTKDEIREETIKTLKGVVAACEEARRIERESGYYHQHMQANLRHILDLKHATEKRISELDGTGLEQRERDMCYWMTTRANYIYDDTNTRGSGFSKFQEKVRKFNPQSVCRRNVGQDVEKN